MTATAWSPDSWGQTLERAVVPQIRGLGVALSTRQRFTAPPATDVD